jgi:hypothetical protein
VDEPALEAAVLVADRPATLFLDGFFVAVTFRVTAGFPRAAGAAFFAAGFTAGGGVPAALVLRFLALELFFAVAFVRAGLVRLRFAFPGFDFTAFAEDVAFGFLAFAVFRAAFLASFACLIASLAAFLSAFLAFFSAFRAALAVAFSAFFARLSSAFDLLAMLAARSVLLRNPTQESSCWHVPAPSHAASFSADNRAGVSRIPRRA